MLSAYKQGFLWLTEQVIPELKGKAVKAVHMKITEYKPDFTKKYRFYTCPRAGSTSSIRSTKSSSAIWASPTSAFTMELVDDAEGHLHARSDRRARPVVYTRRVQPEVVEREYLEKFPGWSRVEVTTGWLTATVDGQPVWTSASRPTLNGSGITTRARCCRGSTIT